jgi:hypothetical protein
MQILNRSSLAMCVIFAVIAGGAGADECVSVGPDVVVRFWDTHDYGSVGDRAAFAFGTDACNIGDEVLNWVADGDHPVISSALYHLKGGRFQQVGLSWVKHGWAADQADRCGCGCVPADTQHLGVGCADAYSAVSNGLQEVMGPRTEVDPYMGSFPFPPSGWGQGGDQIFRRLQVHHADLEPTDYDGAGYYIAEVQFVSGHDSSYGNQFNNTTWQKIWMSNSGDSWSVALTDSAGGTVGEPALRAWAEANPSVRITESHPPGDGSILIGALVSPVVEGWYQYEYAVQNVNAHRGVRAVEIALPIGAHVFDIGFHDVAYHSDEGIDGTDWPVYRTDNALRWQTVSSEINPMGNGLRWGTTYNFRFISNVPPTDGSMMLHSFRQDIYDADEVASRLPNLAVDPCSLVASPCPADGSADGHVDVEDLLLLLQWWGSCGDGTFRPPPDADGDCCVAVEDLLVVLSSWGTTCGFEGACCQQDGGCIMATAAECDSSHGSWSGMLSTCAEVDCSVLTGACCLIDESCEDEVSETACILLGGMWGGNGSTCFTFKCASPIGEDDCEEAMLVEAGLHYVDTTQATTDGPSHLECETGGDGGQIGNDVWLRYEAQSSGQLTLTTCEELGGWGDFDTDLAVYDGVDCDSLVLLGCNDDDSDHDCGTKAGGWHSTVVVPVTEGNGYLLRIGGWQEGNTGTAWVLLNVD